jgi:hypothetical protein
MEIALPVLALTAPSITPPRPFRPGDTPPAFVEVRRDERARKAVATAQAAHESGGTAAIIAPPSLVGALRSELEASGIEFGDAEHDELAASVELLDPRAAKGLEFDHVVLVEPASIIREAEGPQGQRDLYVALTRATRTLTCVHAEPLPWPLGEHELGAPAAARPPAAELDPEPQLDPQAMPSLELDLEPELELDRPEPDGVPEPELAPVPEPAQAGAPGQIVSVGEALVIARMRGMSTSEALARALLTHARGGSEAEVAGAILDPASAEDADVERVLRAATQDLL